MAEYVDEGWNPFVILNDYENAYMDAQQFYGDIDDGAAKTLFEENPEKWPLSIFR